MKRENGGDTVTDRNRGEKKSLFGTNGKTGGRAV